ncbi:ATP-binding cassette domain-containing protein, partial [Brevibacillus laterosporus]|uniref:ATP-binding cassette domain-containing protein n=1 Tax=Brevibacillus laterosporus TaxID=1465 RepID=UPI0022A6C356
FEAVLSSDTPTLRIIKKYEEAVNRYALDQSDSNFNKMMEAQEEMDQNDAWDYNAEIKTILSKLGIHDTTKKIVELSGGQQKRVVLAKTLIEQPDLLLLDEPTNHLDFESIRWLINYVKQYPHTVLFVTHDRYFLNEIATRIVELDRGKLKSYPGNYEDYIAMRAENEVIEQKQQEKQKAEAPLSILQMLGKWRVGHSYTNRILEAIDQWLIKHLSLDALSKEVVRQVVTLFEHKEQSFFKELDSQSEYKLELLLNV